MPCKLVIIYFEKYSVYFEKYSVYFDYKIFQVILVKYIEPVTLGLFTQVRHSIKVLKYV